MRLCEYTDLWSNASTGDIVFATDSDVLCHTSNIPLFGGVLVRRVRGQSARGEERKAGIRRASGLHAQLTA